VCGVTVADVEPRSFPRPVLLLVGMAAGLLVVSGLRSLSDIIGPAFLALVLTIAAQPLRDWAVRMGLPQWVGGVAALLVIYFGLLGLTVSLLVAGARFAALLPTYQDDLSQLIQDGLDRLTALGVTEQQIDSVASEFDLGSLVSFFGELVGGLLGLLSSLFFIVTLVLFMVADTSGFARTLREMPGDRVMFVRALGDFASGTRRYLVVSTVFGLIVAVIDTIALAWIGVPVAVLWGLLAFVTNYIPNIGFVIGVIPPALIGLLEGGVPMMLAVLVAYSVVNVVIQSVIQPRVVGDAVGLSTTLTMLSLVFWSFTLGAVGAVMAIPLSLLTKAILIDSDPRNHWVGPLLSSGAAARTAPRVPDEPPT
jgi:predicted PurR-regulated permease PerM